MAAYSKGEVLVEQLAAVVGAEVRDEAMRTYFKDWSFKHPGPHDFKRVVERASGLELDWYFQYMMHTTDAIDYAVESVVNDEGTVTVELSRRGDFPMPQDVQVTWEDGTITRVHIPLVMMRGHRALGEGEILGKDWPWVEPTYTLEVPSKGRLTAVTLDPAALQADIHRDNNTLTFDLERDQEARQSN